MEEEEEEEEEDEENEEEEEEGVCPVAREAAGGAEAGVVASGTAGAESLASVLRSLSPEDVLDLPLDLPLVDEEDDEEDDEDNEPPATGALTAPADLPVFFCDFAFFFPFAVCFRRGLAARVDVGRRR